MSAGTLTYNKGVITVKSSDTAIDLIAIRAQRNISHSGCFTVPSGYTAYVTNLDFSEASNRGCEVGLYTKASTGTMWKGQRIYSINQDHIGITLSVPYPIAEKTDVELRAKAVSDGAQVSVSMIGWYES